MKFAAVGNISLHYKLDGVNDGPPLVFIHSLGTDYLIWDDVVPCFASNFKVIRYDLRGHGLSDCPTGSNSIRELADDLAGLLDQLQITTSIVIGISVGGMIAMAFAASRPERVSAMVLADTSTTIGTPALWNERIDSLRQRGMEPLADQILARWFTPYFPTQHPLDYRGAHNMLNRSPLNGYIATCEAIRDADLSNLLPQIRAKTLVVCGSEDVSVPPDLARSLAEQLPHARFVLIEGAGHMPCIEQPDRLASVIQDFLQESGYGR